MDLLVDTEGKEEQYRIKSLLVTGDHYQLAIVEDVTDDDELYCARTIAYDPAREEDLDYVHARHEALELLEAFTKDLSKWTPVPKGFLKVESDETPLNYEPVLIEEYIVGKTVEQLVEIEGAFEPENVRTIALELAHFLKECHDSGWIYRDLHPSHVIIAADKSLGIVGTGNATRRGEPPNMTVPVSELAYAAPEIRDEVGGSTLNPSADVYTFGALLSFMLTGEHPRTSVENRLTQVAYQKLTLLKPEGLALLVAKCMAPMAKNRFATIDELIPFLEKDSLPTPTTPGFSMLLLPAPWDGAEDPDNRASRSSISPGPLISVEQTEKLDDSVVFGTPVHVPNYKPAPPAKGPSRAYLIGGIVFLLILALVVAAIFFR